MKCSQTWVKTSTGEFYGPRIGALCAINPSQDTPVLPLLFGGGQERNLRPGTENTPMIAGLGKAAELVCNNLKAYSNHMEDVRDYLEDQLQVTMLLCKL
ncbi:selenocysteine lyase [Plakobranchus ocellatus]|uniref:Selenocysteine lyase n=1 Tax=Plakobranchus ocellatus TaxID=259542 RepID=A0AAV4C197_9GAST|nr:selenocysteine lyase [Plakobranchus ocellatus]